VKRDELLMNMWQKDFVTNVFKFGLGLSTGLSLTDLSPNLAL
jgi:hypothetical protein